MKHLSRGLLANALAAMILTGCGDDIVVPEVPIGINRITVTPATADLQTGQTVTLVASVDASAGVDRSVTWRSADTTIASITATGAVTGLRTGTVAIQAIAVADPTKTGTATIRVNGGNNSGVLGVGVTPSAVNLRVGERVQAVATVDRNAGISGAVTWRSEAANIATVSSTGEITGVATGTAVIVAASAVDPDKQAAVAVTVSAGGIIRSLTVSPQTVSIAPGQTLATTATAQTDGGQAATITWRSLNEAIATVSSAGIITGVANGGTIIRVTAKAGADSMMADITTTVQSITPAQVSLVSITQGGIPVQLANVAGQIEVALAIAPGGHQVDSVRVFLGDTPAAAQQFTSSLPAQSQIILSVNTADYERNSTLGLGVARFTNGMRDVRATIYTRDSSGTGSAANTVAINLNNADAFAASITRPERFASSAGGVQFYGGPGNEGAATLQLYPVMYTAGRSLASATIRFGTGPTVAVTTAPYTTTIGYGGPSVDVDYSGYASPVAETVSIVSATDNVGSPIAGGLIANTTVVGSTPEAFRVDFSAPTVSAIDMSRAAPAVTGWVNAAFNFLTRVTVTDADVGLRATSDRRASYSAPNCGGATDVAMDTGTGADIAECPSNTLGGGVAGAPYTAMVMESDRLGNLGMSPVSSTFGVDKTAPLIRANAGTVVQNGGYSATPVAPFLVDYIDERSGFYNGGTPAAGTAAQSHFLAFASSISPTGSCLVAAAGATTPGVNFITNPTCGLTPITSAVGGALPDGYLEGTSVAVPAGEGYYTYRSVVTDAAGNVSSPVTRTILVDGTVPTLNTPTTPSSITGAANPQFTVTTADNVELRGFSVNLTYPNVGDLRYGLVATSNIFDDIIVASGNQSATVSTTAPFLRRIESVTGAAFPASNLAAAGAPVNVKPTAVEMLVADWRNNTATSASQALVGATIENGIDFAVFNTANPTLAITHFRVIGLDAYGFSPTGLKAQVTTSTSAANAPFARVDFFREVAPGSYAFLGSSATAQASDIGLYRSWVYQLSTPYATRFDGASQAAATAGETVIAIGVSAAGDGLATQASILANPTP
jgi:uncharacterized protein YjdB